MALDINGRKVETDEEGFLVNLSDWSEDVAVKLAESEKIDMKETHWGLVEAVRDFFEEYQKHPSTLDLIHMLGKHLKKSPGEERHELSSTNCFHMGQINNWLKSPVCQNRFLLVQKVSV